MATNNDTKVLCEESEKPNRDSPASTSKCTTRPCKKVCSNILIVILLGVLAVGVVLLRIAATSFLKTAFNKIFGTTDNKSLKYQQQLFELRTSEAYNPYNKPLVALKPFYFDEDERVVSCYYNLPKSLNSTELMPDQLETCMCTHINLAFANLKNKEIYLEDVQVEAIQQIVKWNNNNLKLLLSVGGAGDDNGFSEMVIDHASRKIFIRSIKNILHTLNLHGVDLDWEFPVVHQTGLAKANGSRERQHFSQLLREIRTEFVREKKKYLLTVAAAAQKAIVDAAYDIDQLNEYTDYVNIMTYDFHFYSSKTPLTGLNSPLYSKSDVSLLSTFNVNYTVDMYIEKGLEKSKIVVGIPTYGHSFKLENSDNSMIGSPCSGYGDLGHTGFVSYPEVCTFIRHYTTQVTIVDDQDSKVPYLYRDHEWVSYDNPKSVALKAAYIKNKGIRGAMIYSLNSDDYEGVCNVGNNSYKYHKFPLTRNINEHLLAFTKPECIISK